jgi:hypothetical protein
MAYSKAKLKSSGDNASQLLLVLLLLFFKISIKLSSVFFFSFFTTNNSKINFNSASPFQPDEHKNHIMIFEIITMVSMSITAIWVVMLCGWLPMFQRNVLPPPSGLNACNHL